MDITIFNRTVAQISIKNRLKFSLSHDKLPQSIILYGQKGMGQYALACDLIEHLTTSWENHIICFPTSDTKKTPSNDEQLHKYQCCLKQPYHDHHQEKDLISIEQIRQLEKNILYKSINNRKRIISLWGIEYLTLSASNALLKILEEPPPQTHFILISNHIHMVLPTIRSRCVDFFLSSLSTNDLKNVQDTYPIVQKNLPFSGNSLTQLFTIENLGGSSLIENSFRLMILLCNQNWNHFNSNLENNEQWENPQTAKLILTISLEILLMCLKNESEEFFQKINIPFIQQHSSSIRIFLEQSILRIEQNSKPLITLNGLFLKFKHEIQK